MATLINGNGNNAVYAQQDADLYAGALGESTRILNVGSNLAYTIEDANTIAVADGVILTKEGRRIQVDVGSVDEFTIPTGSAGVTRYYIIGYHLYTDGSANQKCETFVQLMASESETIPEAEFREGATEVYVSLYRIKQIGLNLDTITALLSVGIALTDMTDVIGDTDISGIGDGTLTGGLNAVNQNLTEIMIRYNPTTHYIQIQDNGVWYDYKYFNPIQPVALVPTMTSDTTPRGKASASTIYGTSYEAFRAFDDDGNTMYRPSNNDTTQAWYLEYEFPSEVVINKLSMRYGGNSGNLCTYGLRCSTDGITWNDAGVTIAGQHGEHTVEQEFDNIPAKYARLYLKSGNPSVPNYGGAIIYSLQYYGFE